MRPGWFSLFHPAAYDFEVFFLAGGEQEQHGTPFVFSLFGDKVGEVADDFFGLGAVQRPGFAVAAEDGDVHGDGALALDLEVDLAIGGLGFGDDVAEQEARVALGFGEFDSVDAFDDVALIELAGFLGGGARFDVLDFHHRAFLEHDADADGAEVSDQPRPAIGERGGVEGVVGDVRGGCGGFADRDGCGGWRGCGSGRLRGG